MITSIAIPKLTLTMEGGTLVRWLKREGELVQKDEVLFEIETDKANAEVPSPATGILKKILLVGFDQLYGGEEFTCESRNKLREISSNYFESKSV